MYFPEVPVPYLVWPWIGLGGAIVLLLLLFGTNALWTDLTGPRWKDPQWLAWAGAVAYLLHNVEEYGVDATGTLYGFPQSLGSSLASGPPNYLFLAVNIPMFWVIGPTAAILTRRRVGLAPAMATLELINAVTHIAGLPISGYSSGLLTAVLLFVPLALWTFHVCYGRGKRPYSEMWRLIGIAIAYHVVLLGTLATSSLGLFPFWLATVILLANHCGALALWCLAGRDRTPRVHTGLEPSPGP